MTGIEITSCSVKRFCSYRNSSVCYKCSRNNSQRQDYFQQDIQLIKDKLEEISNNAINKID